MHIEPTQGFDALGSPDGTRSAPQPEQVWPSGEGKPAETRPDTESVPAAYVEQAAAAEEVRSEAVAEARRALASGELDTAAAAEAAADAILTLGI